jgi:hypothetical protein
MKNIFLLLFFLALVVIACREPKKLAIYKKPSFDSIGKMPYDKAVLLYGKPIDDYIFNIQKNGLGGSSYRLYRKYSNFPNLDILQAVWRKDSITDIMIWYKKENQKWQPIDTIMYDHGSEF